jgi:hypothetical protein
MIRHKRSRKGLLVPLLEDLFQYPVDVDGPDDISFIVNTLERQVARSVDRVHAPKYSPSQLASCLRQVYLLKHHQQLGVNKLASVRIEPNFYFFTGNWIHLKWQFALFKLDKFIGDPTIFRLHGVEIPIVSKHKDHGGTVDALCSVYEEPIIVDAKGLNVRTFGEITRGYVPDEYVIQLTDYQMLFNSQRLGKLPKIKRGLLLVENKGGPDNKHPLALVEHEVEIRTHLPEVRRRLEVLREHERNKEIPPPECVKTTTLQFQGCPFRDFCRQEVKAIERELRRAESEDAERLSVETPGRSRNHRPRRNSKR